jgi:hypothetical protein
MQLFALFSPLIATVTVALFLSPYFPDWRDAIRDDDRRYWLVRNSIVPAVITPFLLYTLHLMVMWLFSYEYNLLHLYLYYLVGYHGIFTLAVPLVAWLLSLRLERGSTDIVWHTLIFIGISFTLLSMLDLIRIQNRWNAVVGLAFPVLRSLAVILCVPVVAYRNQTVLGVAVLFIAIAALVPMWMEWLLPLPALAALLSATVLVAITAAHFVRVMNAPR